MTRWAKPGLRAFALVPIGAAVLALHDPGRWWPVGGFLLTLGIADAEDAVRAIRTGGAYGKARG